MALFRKNASAVELSGAFVHLFMERGELFLQRVRLDYARVRGVEAPHFSEDEVLEFQDLWVAVAALLSSRFQSGDAAFVSNCVIQGFSQSQEGLSCVALAERIVGAKISRDLIFHWVSADIVKHSFPGIAHVVFPYPNIEPKWVTISGIELASCLRGVDFILKKFKLGPVKGAASMETLLAALREPD
jgi:hypothetical protein